MLKRATLLAVFLLLPASVLAKQETLWNFLDGNVPGRWEVKGGIPAPVPTADGLHIRTDRKGYIIRPTEVSHPIEQIELTYVSPMNVQISLLFRSQDAYYDMPLLELPVSLQPTEEPRTITLDVSRYDNWDPATADIGLAFSPGTEFGLREIRLTGYTLPGKAWQGFLSFWEFDAFKPYSINFLWGPHLAFTPAQRAHIFDAASPSGARGNLAVFALIGITAMTALALRWSGKCNARSSARIVLIGIAALWVLYDIRMGAEFIGYARNDVQTYWSKPLLERTFRTHLNFQAFAQWVAPKLADEQQYVFIPPVEEFVDFMRYSTYPALPIRPEAADDSVRSWVIFANPDVMLSDEGRLTLNGEPISPSGRVVDAYDPDSFVFEVTQ